jgi:hypothetical protein
MKLASPILIIALACSPLLAEAKLPPPTPEQIAAEQEKRALEDARLQREKALLEQVQDRVAQRYRLDHAQRQPAGRVSDTNMPNNVRQLPGTAAPEGGREQSAEAHSAPAK